MASTDDTPDRTVLVRRSGNLSPCLFDPEKDGGNTLGSLIIYIGKKAEGYPDDDPGSIRAKLKGVYFFDDPKENILRAYPDDAIDLDVVFKGRKERDVSVVPPKAGEPGEGDGHGVSAKHS